MSKSSFCYLCGKPIKFDNEYISERTGKKIPLDAETNEPHNCPVRRSQQEQQQLQQQQPSPQQEKQQRRYHQCNKGCGQEIYFDANSKSQGGKSIPLDKETGLPHQCHQQ
jgi:hypothetical protein